MVIKHKSGLVRVPANFEKYVKSNLVVSGSQERKARMLGIIKDDWHYLADYLDVLEPTLLFSKEEGIVLAFN